MMETTHIVKVLPPLDRSGRETPSSIRALDAQVQRTMEFPIQPRELLRPIRLRSSRERLHLRHGTILFGLIARSLLLLLLNANLADLPILALDGPHHTLLDKLIYHARGLAEVTSDEDLVVPRVLGVGIVPAEFARRLPVALLRFELPVDEGGSVFLVVEVPREGECQALVQTFLIEIKGLLEGGWQFSQKRWPREDQAGMHIVLARGLRCDGRDDE